MYSTNLVALDRSNKQALYQQIAAQIKTKISDGRLPAKTRLPTIRKLSGALKVNRLTIQSAYDELQADGWIECIVGKGTYVSETVKPSHLISRVSQPPTADLVLDNISQMAQIVGMRSLAYAEADPNLFPASEFWNILGTLEPDALTLLQHGSPLGDTQLRIEFAGLLKTQGIEVSPNEILITSGVLQGLSLVVQTIAQPGDNVLVEQPTYHGLLNILKLRGVNAYGVPLDSEGPNFDVLEQMIIKMRPRFFYVIPNFHNPTGSYMSQNRRHEVLRLAKAYNFTIIEDDCYGQLSYDMPPLTSLKAEDHSEQVIHLSGVSKTMMSGLRVGYVVAPEPIHQRLQELRRATDLCNPPIIQRTVAEFIRRGHLKAHLKRVIPIYRQRRDVLLQTLREAMPPTVEWTYPYGGFSCWLTIPRSKSLVDLYERSLHHGVAFTAGKIFLIESERDNIHLRLCFGNQPSEVIRESIILLSQLIRSHS